MSQTACRSLIVITQPLHRHSAGLRGQRPKISKPGNDLASRLPFVGLASLESRGIYSVTRCLVSAGATTSRTQAPSLGQPSSQKSAGTPPCLVPAAQGARWSVLYPTDMAPCMSLSHGRLNMLGAESCNSHCHAFVHVKGCAFMPCTFSLLHLQPTGNSTTNRRHPSWAFHTP